MYNFCKDYESILENIITSTLKYVNDNVIKALVIGMSGGIDSTLTAAIASEVVKRSDNNVTVKGSVIDIESNKSEINRGVEAAQMFCDYSELIKLDGIYYLLAEDIVGQDIFKKPGVGKRRQEIFDNKIRLGNLKARLRMIKLYDLAKKYNGMVLSTDNYTEYLLGFWTLHGDVGDYGMTQHVWKTEMYGIAKYMADKFRKEGEINKAESLVECINAIPTDGLGITTSDFDQICPDDVGKGSPVELYYKVDTLLHNYINGQHPDDLHSNKVISRHINSGYKRENPVSISREYVIKGIDHLRHKSYLKLFHTVKDSPM